MIAAQARLISLAATGLNENGTRGDGDLTGVVELADRIEQQFIEIADEVKLWRARLIGQRGVSGPNSAFAVDAADESTQGQSAALNRSRSAGVRGWGAAFHRWPFTDG